MPPADRFRSYRLVPGDPITFEVHQADGSVATVRGVVDSVPWVAGERAQLVVVRDAAASPGPVPR